MDNGAIGITDLIEQVKSELLSEENRTDPIFELEQIELEISFTAERNKSGEIDLKVFNVGQNIGDSKSHSVKILLSVLDEDELTADIDPEWRRRMIVQRRFATKKRRTKRE